MGGLLDGSSVWNKERMGGAKHTFTLLFSWHLEVSDVRHFAVVHHEMMDLVLCRPVHA